MLKRLADRFSRPRGLLCAGAIGLGLASGTAVAGDAAAPGASPWVREHASRVRMIAGAVTPGKAAGKRIYAGLEIELDEGWKTYWRNPGTSGVPPRIAFDGSENLAKAELLFPAPMRFKDRDGDTIGYKKHVILPVALTPVDPSKPIVLAVAAEFGLCRDICIPVQPSLRVTVPPAASGDGAVDGHLAEALGRVPRPAATAAAAPRIERVTARLSGDKPQVVIEARFPGEAGHGDVFLEAPDGLWIPLPQPAGAARDGVRRFVVDLTDGADVSDLKGRSIRATLVGSQSQSEATFDLVELN